MHLCTIVFSREKNLLGEFFSLVLERRGDNRTTGQPLPLALFLGGPQDLSNHKWKLPFLKPDTFTALDTFL